MLFYISRRESDLLKTAWKPDDVSDPGHDLVRLRAVGAEFASRMDERWSRHREERQVRHNLRGNGTQTYHQRCRRNGRRPLLRRRREGDVHSNSFRWRSVHSIVLCKLFWMTCLFLYFFGVSSFIHIYIYIHLLIGSNRCFPRQFLTPTSCLSNL